MKLVPALLLLALLATPAGAQQKSFYDRNGSFAGSTSSQGNSTSVYDKNGHFDGSVIRNKDGSTSYYDARGHFSGSSPGPVSPRHK